MVFSMDTQTSTHSEIQLVKVHGVHSTRVHVMLGCSSFFEMKFQGQDRGSLGTAE